MNLPAPGHRKRDGRRRDIRPAPRPSELRCRAVQGRRHRRPARRSRCRIGFEVVLAESAEEDRRPARRRVEPRIEIFLGEQHRGALVAGLALVLRWALEASEQGMQIAVQRQDAEADERIAAFADPAIPDARHAERRAVDPANPPTLGLRGAGRVVWNVKTLGTVSYTHLRAHETDSYLVC